MKCIAVKSIAVKNEKNESPLIDRACGGRHGNRCIFGWTGGGLYGNV